MDVEAQRGNVRRAAEVIGAIAAQHRVVLTHGNGPQVGLLALQNEAFADAAPYPIDVLGAETEGMVGYLLEQELSRFVDPARLATLLTQVVVDEGDPAFAHPTKPIGPMFDRERAEALAADRGWAIAQDGDAWRRVVASPAPRRIVELPAIRILVDHHIVVTCAGGGGVPVVDTGEGGLRGVEAVIDKDRAAALLAATLDADMLLLLTDVDGVYRDWGSPDQALVREATPAELRTLDLAAGSMGPKVDAACAFVEGGGGASVIASLEDGAQAIRGERGTVVRIR